MLGFVDIRTLLALQIEHAIVVCSSCQEGYGHFINDARRMGSLVMTTDHAPMNEFVKEEEQGPCHFTPQFLSTE
ncbi:hypothetical protein BC830DRAFT_1118846 [Chytriomyces sp. MP71]|nr:hypothetical protein BC830DRAFT_1118846 [Chytriomyces sp. MP71]